MTEDRDLSLTFAVELSCRYIADAPNVVEEREDGQARIGVYLTPFFCLSRSLPFLIQLGDLPAATR